MTLPSERRGGRIENNDADAYIEESEALCERFEVGDDL